MMINADNIVKYYGNFKAVDGISFSIKKGEIVGLLGPNGAGKSSTIRILCGYLSATEGEVEVDGINVKDHPSEVKNRIGYLPESAPVYSEMMVFDYLDYIANIRNIPKEKIIQSIKKTSELCGLAGVMHKNVSQISKGYRQRVGLAHALIGDPDILVLDEPTTGLDPNQIVEIRKLIKDIGKEKTVILCSHILSEVEATCDRIIIINNGKIVADDITENITQKNSAKHTIFTEFKASTISEVETTLKKLDYITNIEVDQQVNEDKVLGVKIGYEGDQDRREDIIKHVFQSGLPLISFYQERQSLEKVFRELTINSEPSTVSE